MVLQWKLEMIEEIKESKKFIHANTNACALVSFRDVYMYDSNIDPSF